MNDPGKRIPRASRKLVLVDWEDASGASDTGWRFTDNVEQTPFMCRSVGWIVREGKNHITIAPHLGHITEPEDEEQIHGFMHLPRAMIRKMKVLKP